MIYKDKYIIKLEGNNSTTLTSRSIYEKLLPQINDYYRHYNNEDKTPIVFLLDEIERVHSSALPLLIILGEKIRNLNGEPIFLSLPNKKNILSFLYHSYFLTYSDNRNIFNYNNEIIGDLNAYRQNHRLHRIPADKSYSKMRTQLEKEEYRVKLTENIASYFYQNEINIITNDFDIFTATEVDSIIICLSELTSNSAIHGESVSYTFVQTGKFNTLISTGDIGVGFSSLSKKDGGANISNKFKKESKYRYMYKVLDALEYSKNRYLEKHIHSLRDNLFSVLLLLMRKNCKMRIHYLNTQLVFSGKCHKCIGKLGNEEIKKWNFIDCAHCFQEPRERSIFIDSSGLAGVHIELEIPRKDGACD